MELFTNIPHSAEIECLFISHESCDNILMEEISLASSERIDFWEKGNKEIIKSNTSPDI